MLVKIASKDSETVINALIKHASKLPHELYKSLTWDRGTEMAGHKRFTVATDIAVYFCDPQHPWQRGSNENTNGLLSVSTSRKVPTCRCIHRPNSTP
jgi:IS30 family transposase